MPGYSHLQRHVSTHSTSALYIPWIGFAEMDDSWISSDDEVMIANRANGIHRGTEQDVSLPSTNSFISGLATVVVILYYEIESVYLYICISIEAQHTPGNMRYVLVLYKCL